MRKPIVLILSSAVLAGTAIAPSEALADKSFRGKTQQGRTVALTTTDDNVLKRMRINWVTFRCTRSIRRFQHFTRFIPPFKSATPGAFDDGGSLTVKDPGGIRSRMSITTSGRYDAAGNKWNGWIQARVVVRQNGTVISRCSLRRTYFTAGPA